MVIILQYTKVLGQHAVHLKFTHFHMSNIFQLKERERAPGGLSRSFNKNIPWIVVVLIFCINVTVNSLCEGVRLFSMECCANMLIEIKKED